MEGSLACPCCPLPPEIALAEQFGSHRSQRNIVTTPSVCRLPFGIQLCTSTYHCRSNIVEVTQISVRGGAAVVVAAAETTGMSEVAAGSSLCQVVADSSAAPVEIHQHICRASRGLTLLT